MRECGTASQRHFSSFFFPAPALNCRWQRDLKPLYKMSRERERERSRERGRGRSRDDGERIQSVLVRNLPHDVR